MTQFDPSRRPSARQALEQWHAIRSNISFWNRYCSIRDFELSGSVQDYFYFLGSLFGFITRILMLLFQSKKPSAPAVRYPQQSTSAYGVPRVVRDLGGVQGG